MRVRAARQPSHTGAPRILVIRRNRLGDMIYTVPLLHALRRHHPRAHIAVACDPPGAPIAQSCEAINEVITLAQSWNPWQAVYRNAAALQDYDVVIAAKGGFDKRLATLARLTNAPTRIGFERSFGAGLLYYTDPVTLPDDVKDEHQIETLLRLLQPMGMVRTTAFSVNLSLRVPDESRAFAAEQRSKPPFTETPGYMLINYSSTAPLKFREEDFIALARRILGATNLAIGFVAAPLDQQLAHEVAMCMASKRVIALDTPGPMDLAALMEKALVIFTPEGGAAHLAAAMNTPALVLWSEGPFNKWHSRGKRHAYVHAERGEKFVPVDRVWEALQPFLHLQPQDVEHMMNDVFEQPRPPELSS
ncbi:MAG TPA: glycosyltransferase family 9 protein [Candidatus Methylacidiphilales bacterium]|nr:glycosyltransferase family 9 protein [Candidatus Methylacidiphilales bacterium]